MERGLLWLPLLIFFFWLTYTGWREYQKVDSYQRWAVQFEQAKYDIYSVLGYQQKQITWGKPTPTGPINLQTFSLEDIREIRLLLNNQPFTPDASPQGNPSLEFIPTKGTNSFNIPFTELSLATKWLDYLHKEQVKP
jgi:hypothetical protein